MKLSVFLLVLLSLQSRAEDDSIMGIISKLVNKMEANYPSADKLDNLIGEFKAYQETDSERDQSLADQVSGQAAQIQNVAQSLEQAVEEVKANREADNEQVQSVMQQAAANGAQIQDLTTSVQDSQQQTEAKMSETTSKLESHVEELKQEDGNLGRAVEKLESTMLEGKFNLQTQIEALTGEKEELEGELEEYKAKVAALEISSSLGITQMEEMQGELDAYKKKIADLENSPSTSSASSYLWIISNYERNRRMRKKITSPPFYSSSLGYRMQVYAYLHNGNYLSLFFKLMRGTYDDILEWPFPYSVKFELLNQRKDVPVMRNITSITNEERAGNPDVFDRPTTISGNAGWGFTKFIEESIVESKYLDHDKIYIKVTVV